ncbi:MAG: ATPase, T2SS/T4P/T4SS family [Lacunisphaera sp.]
MTPINSQLVAVVPRQVPVKIGTDAEGRLSYDEQALAKMYDSSGIYPFGLASSGLDVSTFKLWFAWNQKHRRNFAPETLPWVPVGRAGPVLIMGHCQPEQAEIPLLAEGMYQPVLLTGHAYKQQLRAVSLMYAGAVQNEYSAQEFVEGPEWAVSPNCKTVSDAVKYIVSSMIIETVDMTPIARLAEREKLAFEELPLGLRAAVWKLMGRGPIVDLTCMRGPGEMEALIPEPLRNRVLPVHLSGKHAYFATSETDYGHIEDLMLATLGEGWQLRYVIFDATRGAQRTGHDENEKDKIFVGGNKPSDEKAEVTITLDAKVLERFDPRKSGADPKDVFLWLLNSCLKDESSDMHIEPGLSQARVRSRRDGELVELLGMADPFCRTLVASAKSMIGMSSDMFNSQDSQFSVRRGDAVVNVRVSAMPIRKTYQSLVLRFLPRKSRTVQLENLDQPEITLRILKHAITRPQGLILVCGPTGSGKTTTLYAALGMLNTADNKIVTAEDPVEYEVEGIMQAAVDRLRGVTFEKLVETQLRQDPDICLIGEIRNKETAEVAMQLSLTGHLVFATLHTLSSAKAIRRLLDLDVNANVLSESLLLVQSQRLARRLCPKCREPVSMTEGQRKVCARHKIEIDDPTCYVPRIDGCAHCRKKGFFGRIAIMDLLPATNDIKELILQGGNSAAIEQLAEKRKFPNMVQEAIKHALLGNITLDDALVHEDPWEILEKE